MERFIYCYYSIVTMKEEAFCLNDCKKSPLNLFFDKTYCTNLNRRTDR